MHVVTTIIGFSNSKTSNANRDLKWGTFT